MSAAAAGGSQRNGSGLRDRNMKKTANGTSPGLAFARRKTKEETTRSTRSSGRSVARASPAPPAFEKLVRGDHLLVRADYREESYGIRREAFCSAGTSSSSQGSCSRACIPGALLFLFLR